MTKDEILEMARLNFPCPNCEEKVALTLLNEDEEITCPHCNADLTTSDELRRQIADIKSAREAKHPDAK